MNEPEVQTGSATNDFAVEELQGDVQSLRTLLSVSLLVMIVFSFCVNVFLFKQVSVLRAQISQEQSAQAQAYNSAMDFWAKMNDFAKTHPDFTFFIDKYKPVFATNNLPVKK